MLTGLVLLATGGLVYAYVVSSQEQANLSAVESRWASQVNAIPVFRESEYRIKAPRYMVLTTDKNVLLRASGSGFLLEVRDQVYLITAKHVVEGPVQYKQLQIGETEYTVEGTSQSSILKLSDRARFGVKAIELEPVELKADSDGSDVMCYKVADPERFRGVVHQPAQSEVGEEVTVHGYPQGGDENDGDSPRSVSNIAVLNLQMTAQENTYFVVQGDQEVGAGFSGSPVLNPAGEVVGMVIRSNGSQARCLYIQNIMKQLS